MKFLHFALFHASQCVCDHLFGNGVDPETLVLPDNKFMARLYYILPTFFNYKPKISIEQFFKYGFAESKLLLVTDVVNLVKRKHKLLMVQRNLQPGKRA